MVYATAQRRAPADVEDVTQAVFLLLWEKAGRLAGRRSIAGWLYRTTIYACRNASKVRRRREHYEREAAMLKRNLAQAEGAEIRDVLDDAPARLGEKYRRR